MWLREDKAITYAKLKEEAKTRYKSGRFVVEDRASFIVANKSTDGTETFFFVGLYKLGDVQYVCQTATSIAPNKQVPRLFARIVVHIQPPVQVEPGRIDEAAAVLAQRLG